MAIGRKLAWMFELQDRMSGPAMRMRHAMDAVGESTRRVGHAGDESGSRGGLFGAVAGGEIAAKAFEKITEAVTETVAKVAELGFETAKFGIEATSFKQNTLLALKTVLGTREAAQGVMDNAVKFAMQTPFTDKDVLKWTKGLLIGGFSKSEVPVLLQAIGDFGAMNDMDTGLMERVMFDLREINSIGHLTGRQMMSLGMAGLNTGKVYEKLGKAFGTTAAGARKLEEAGKIGSKAAIFAIVDSLKDLAGGQVGGLLKEMSTNVTGLLSTLRGVPFNMLKDLDQTAGYEAFRGTLANLVDMVQPTSSFGSRMKGSLSRTFNGVFGVLFGDLAGADGMGKLASMGDVAVRAVDLIGAGLEYAAIGAKSFVDGLLPALGISGSLFGPDGKLDATMVKSLGSSMHELGANIGVIVNALADVASLLGMINHLLHPIDWFMSANPDLANSAGGQFANRLGDFMSPGGGGVMTRAPMAFLQYAEQAVDDPEAKARRARWYGPDTASTMPTMAGGAVHHQVDVKVEQHFHVDGKTDTEGLAQRLNTQSQSGMSDVFSKLSHVEGTDR